MNGFKLPPGVLSIPEEDLLTEDFTDRFTNGGRPKNKRTPHERAKIGRLLDRCHAAGYYPIDLDDYGRLVFAKRVESKTHRRLSAGLEKHLQAA